MLSTVGIMGELTGSACDLHQDEDDADFVRHNIKAQTRKYYLTISLETPTHYTMIEVCYLVQYTARFYFSELQSR